MYNFILLLLVSSTMAVLSSCYDHHMPSDNIWPPYEGDLANHSKEEVVTNPLAELIAFVEKSELAWQMTKKNISDTYSYSVNFTSGLAPPAKTIISVTKGRVTERMYSRDNWPQKDWVEAEKQIGSHKRGASPVTIDKLYWECLNTVLTRDPRSASFTVSTFSDGTLQYCTSWPCGAVDDASDGVSISSIKYVGFADERASSKSDKSYDGCPN